MAEKVSTEYVASINSTDDNWVSKGGKKRNLEVIEKETEVASPENTSKRLKLSDKFVEVSDVKIDENGKIVQSRNENIDTVENRTHCISKLTSENLKTSPRFVLAKDSVLSMVQNTMKQQKENKFQTEREDQHESKIPNAKLQKKKKKDRRKEKTVPNKVEEIAQRTPLKSIESSFQPPIIDMYSNDTIYKEFLCELTKPLNQTSGVGSVADDTEDERDPEYKIQKGEEEEGEDEDEIDYDEICGENPLEVPGDEVSALMTESLLELDLSFLDESNLALTGNKKKSTDPEKEQYHVSEKERNETNSEVEGSSNDSETDLDTKDSNEKENINSSKGKKVTESHSENVPHSVGYAPLSPVQVENVRKEWMIPDERRQLDEQMRMHVQILTQSYLLSYGFTSLQFLNESSMIFLNELQTFASIGTSVNQQSAFSAHNLDHALDIVNKFANLTLSEKDKKKKLNKSIPECMKKVFASNKTFIYPELLPKCGFYTFYLGSKACFSLAEDYLIALGLEQFSYMDNPSQGIHEYLLPTKSEFQIKCRIRNSKQKKESENPIAYFYKHNKLPEFNRVIRIFDPNNIKAPEEYPPSALPLWMEPYCRMVRKKIRKDKQSVLLQGQGKKPKFILPCIQIVPTINQEFNSPHPGSAPQPIICQVFSVNENNMSQGSSGIILPKRIKRRRKRLAINQVNKSTQFPESPKVPSDSCISQSIKQETHSEETSDEESVENEDSSDSSSNEDIPLCKNNYSVRKRTVVTRSMSTSHELCQTDVSSSSIPQISASSTFLPVSVKEKILSSESSDEKHLEKNSAAHVSHSKTSNLRLLNNSPHKKRNQLQVEHSTLTEPRLRIVTSQGDESSNSDEGNVICSELLAPIQRFFCGISEDAVMPPESSSVQKHLPSDFSAIRDIITSEEKQEKLLSTAKSKVCSKKSRKYKRTWSKEEDQLIISNCQKYGMNKRAFRASADEIGSILPISVKQRFIYLLKLLSEKLKDEE